MNEYATKKKFFKKLAFRCLLRGIPSNLKQTKFLYLNIKKKQTFFPVTTCC